MTPIVFIEFLAIGGLLFSGDSFGQAIRTRNPFIMLIGLLELWAGLYLLFLEQK